MKRYDGFCWDEQDHKERAQRDARYDHRDREYYDRHSCDPCKEVYTKEFDRERDRIERERYEEQQAEERRQEERAREVRNQRIQEEEYYDRQREQEQYEEAREQSEED